jgi:hypothetical protein
LLTVSPPVSKHLNSRRCLKTYANGFSCRHQYLETGRTFRNEDFFFFLPFYDQDCLFSWNSFLISLHSILNLRKLTFSLCRDSILLFLLKIVIFLEDIPVTCFKTVVPQVTTTQK